MPMANATHVKIRKTTKQRLDRLAAEYRKSYEEHHRVKVRGAADGHVSIDAIITKALDELESKRRRSAAKKKK